MIKIINMNHDILNVIHAVLDYKKFLHSYHVMLLNDKQFDSWAMSEEFYYSIANLPDGMDKNKQDFFRILAYESQNRKTLRGLDGLQESELCEVIWKREDCEDHE